MKKIFLFFILLLLLTGCHSYKVENGKWSYVQWDEGRGRSVTEVQSADQSSFVPINDKYGKDDKRVYYVCIPIAGADPHTFVYLGKNYAKDKDHVFYWAKPIEGADPNTFKIIKEGLGMDKKDFYSGVDALKVIDLDSFTIINEEWAKDKKAYYALHGVFIKYFGKVDCDYATMKILNSGYAIDKNRSYYEGAPMEGVDLKTFRAINYIYAKDRYREYVLDRPKGQLQR